MTDITAHPEEEQDPPCYVSTGELPEPQKVRELLEKAHQLFSGDTTGEISNVYPALAKVPPDLFGLCVVGASGNVFGHGDWEFDFTIMSVSKPFVFALMAELRGAADLRALIGVNATGYPFNSLAAVERHPQGLTNPMVNSGAIATTSLAPGKDLEEKWAFLHTGLSRFAGRKLSMNEEVLASARTTNFRNRAIGDLLQSKGAIFSGVDEAIELYTRQCSLNVTARDLAVMAAALADGGVNPLTGERVVAAAICHYTLAVMATAGLYDTSGDWLYEIGLPGKSGIGGGLLAVSPGKGGLGCFAPRLDGAGNSVKGQRAARYLSRSLGLDLFVSAPLV